MSWRMMISVSILLGTAAAACGQGVPGRQQVRPPGKVIMIRPFELGGTITGVRRGLIAVKAPADEVPWMLAMPAKVEVRVTGQADPSVLRPGMFVRFVAQVDKRKSLVQGKVARLTIFTPSQESGRMPGVFYPGQGEEGFGMGPGGGLQPQAEQEPANENIVTLDIRGRVSSARGRLVTVYAPNQIIKPSLRFELTETATLDLDLSDYSIAKPGDKIVSMCYRPNEAMPKAVTAQKVKIELAEVYGAPKRRPGRGPHPQPQEGDQPPAGEPPVQPPVGDQPPVGNQPPVGGLPLPPGAADIPLVKLLMPTAEEMQGKQGMKLGMNGGDPLLFIPCKPITEKTIRETIGLPERAVKINASLPIGEAGAKVEVEWQLWIFDPVNVFIDEKGQARYFAVTEKKAEEEEGP